MKKKHLLFILLFTIILACSMDDNSEISEENNTPNSEIYFPPLTSDSWETTSLNDLNWSEDQLQSLLDFLELKNTKSFMILHKGKIAVEYYFNGHSSTSPWYWASAGKTLTSTVSGIAQDEGLININTKISDYIGTGWTSAPLEKENLITCKNLLSMNSGLDDSIGENIDPENLNYIADANSRWAYHNVYIKMQDVIGEVSSSNWEDYFSTKLKNKIGMSGAWIQTGEFNVYWSTTRSMARFGLLISAKGTWENTQVVSENFLNEAINTSQNINKSYGYLWWLNGKSSYKLPQSQVEFQGELIPNAPNDMYCALGKNDQKIYIVPSKDLVIIRMGNAADEDNFALSNFDNELWKKINLVIQN